MKILLYLAAANIALACYERCSENFVTDAFNAIEGSQFCRSLNTYIKCWQISCGIPSLPPATLNSIYEIVRKAGYSCEIDNGRESVNTTDLPLSKRPETIDLNNLCSQAQNCSEKYSSEVFTIKTNDDMCRIVDTFFDCLKDACKLSELPSTLTNSLDQRISQLGFICNKASGTSQAEGGSTDASTTSSTVTTSKTGQSVHRSAAVSGTSRLESQTIVLIMALFVYTSLLLL